jgi:predicted XRE-type DNA-binding protein
MTSIPPWKFGLSDAEVRYARAQIGFQIHEAIKGRKLDNHEVAHVLGISPREVSDLLNGHFSRFATSKLLDLAKKL